MKTEEAALIERSQGGDLEAFNALVLAYQVQVYNLCLRMLGSPQAAEDATQEAFIAAYRAVSRFRQGSFRAWLLRIAANACYDELRRRRSRPQLPLEASTDDERPVAELPASDEPPDQRAERLELARLLREGLVTLPPDQRLAVILRDVQGFAYEEVAEVTSASLGTVKSRISRGRAAMREFLLARGELLPSRFRFSGEGDDHAVV
ncbi:MAG: RNA polymerase subunit sigma-24 [Chloroflexi bacterium RBG_16_64_32]|jgi:RNA polymerase sigma-70 factor (ECF subfamily)|nr:MAG: RNA polymerase subunit sigma-24 [Chloroflexi bacterium RBG_16_64_32]